MVVYKRMGASGAFLDGTQIAVLLPFILSSFAQNEVSCFALPRRYGDRALYFPSFGGWGLGDESMAVC